MLVWRAVERDHESVNLSLAHRIETDHSWANLLDDVTYRPADPLAAVARLVAIAQFNRLILAGRSARRHGGGRQRAVIEPDLNSNGGIAP